MATIAASENEFPKLLLTEGAAAATPASGLIVAYAKAGGVFAWKDDAGVEHLVGEGDLAAHLADTSDAHDASAISVADAGNVFTGTDVEAVLAELYSGISGGGIPATIFDAQGDLIVASAADTAARLALGTSGQALVSNGTTAVWGRPKGTPVDFAFSKRSSGDVTCSADQIWADVDSGLDMTLTAASGDIIEASVSVGASSTDNVHIYFTFMTIVSASPVNDIATGAAPSNSTLGVPGWQIVAAVSSHGSGSVMYTLQSGDITSGTVVLRLRYRTSANTDRVIAANANRSLWMSARNLGPAI